MAISVRYREIKFYYDRNGNSPFESWLNDLRDVRGRAQILGRINRAAGGNFGDHRHLKDGVWELKVNFGPGYRVYFALDESDAVVLLLAGGSKGSQSSDITMSKEFWQEHIGEA